VLEASWANVWMQDAQGILVTPPADGRILPGITRRRLLELHDVPTSERSITLEELREARAIVLTSSLRLVTPANLQEPPGQAARDLAKRLVHSLNRASAHCCA
jgi:para-aminobenzoate synthetase/4-amino-4-deoxychorismate lyase